MKMFVLIGFFFIYASSALADPASGRVLKLKDAIQKALDQNPELQAFKFEALRTQAEVSPKGAYDDPMLSFEAMNYPVDTWSPREFGMTGRQVSLSQKIPFPGKLSKLSRATSQAYEAARERFLEKQLEIIKSVKLSFFELYLAYKRWDILKQQKNLIHQMVSVTRSKYTLGKVPQAELLNFQVEEAGLMEAILTAEKEIQTKSAELRAWMGLAPEPGVDEKPEEIQKTVLDGSQMQEGKLLEKIMAHNPRLKAAQFQKEASHTMLSYSRFNYLPDFELMAAYTFRSPSMDDRGTDFFSARVSLSLPLWALSKQSQEVKAASLGEAQAEAMEEGARIALQKEVRAILAGLKSVHEKVRLYEGGLLQLTQQAVLSGKSGYLTGKIEYATLLSAINTRFKMEGAYYETVVDHEVKIAELEALLAEPLSAQ